MNRKYYAIIPVNVSIFPKNKKFSQVQLPEIPIDPVPFSNQPFIFYPHFFNFSSIRDGPAYLLHMSLLSPGHTGCWPFLNLTF